MSFEFNGQHFEVVEDNGEKLVFKEKKENKEKEISQKDVLPGYSRKYHTDYFEKNNLNYPSMKEKLLSYEILGSLKKPRGKELVERVEEAIRIENYLWERNMDDNTEAARKHTYYCFRELDEYLYAVTEDFKNKTFYRKEEVDNYSLIKAYVESINW